MKDIKVALIGVGGRGEGVYRVALRQLPFLKFVGVCDKVRTSCKYVVSKMAEQGKGSPEIFEDYKECIDKTKPDAIVIATAWDSHLEISTYAMEKGIAVITEVGGAYDIPSLWELVNCYERTKTPFMMAENCCFGRLELLALNMKRKGLLGRIVHCDGGYMHDCRTMVDRYINEGHFRVLEHIYRNCDTYPTHDLGPISKLLDINCGNRFLTLTSTASGSFSLKEYMKGKQLEDYPVTTQWLTTADKNKRIERFEELKNAEFMQGDIITTVLKCANQETVTLTLDTTLPRWYSRKFTVRGTKGMISEDNNSVFLDGDDHSDWTKHYNNVEEYYEKYEHPLWLDYKPGAEGHGGMDALVFKAFFEALQKGKELPLDVYDAATWMSVTALSEQSILTGQTVVVPDFTRGKWKFKKNNFLL